jgi:hypothetical protein
MVEKKTSPESVNGAATGVSMRKYFLLGLKKNVVEFPVARGSP